MGQLNSTADCKVKSVALCEFFRWTAAWPAVPEPFPLTQLKAKQSSNMCTLQAQPSFPSRGFTHNWFKYMYHEYIELLFFNVVPHYLENQVYWMLH